MKDDFGEPEVQVSDSLNCELADVANGVEDNTVRPTTQGIRDFLSKKPWLLGTPTPPQSEALRCDGKAECDGL